MITEFYTYQISEMKKKNETINKLNVDFFNKSITIKIFRRYYKNSPLREETYVIDKISFKEPNIMDSDRRNGSLSIALKGKGKKEIEITKDSFFFIEEYEKPHPITSVDETLKEIADIYRAV
jgi:hypothetical protein